MYNWVYVVFIRKDSVTDQVSHFGGTVVGFVIAVMFGNWNVNGLYEGILMTVLQFLLIFAKTFEKNALQMTKRVSGFFLATKSEVFEN